MWKCPKCGTMVDPSFDTCWRCGTSADGVEDPSFLQADAPRSSASPTDLDMPRGGDPLAEPSDTASADLVACYWALDLMQAKFLADQLTDNGIPAVSDVHDMHDALGSMSSGPRVWVRAEDLPRARAWLGDYDRNFKAHHGGVERA